MSTKTVTKKVEDLLGSNFEGLESASLRLQKFATLGLKSSTSEYENFISKAHNYGRKLPLKSYSKIKNSKSFTAKLGARMMVNKAEGIFEGAGLKFHRFLNCPYIPGSALKGVARHAAWWQWSEVDEKENDNLAREIAEIFGYPTGEKSLDNKLKALGLEEQKGKVCFLDAFPANKEWKLEVDILTPHGDCDTKNPTPITFPVVAKGSVFQFTLVSENENLLKRAKEYLQNTLQDDGVGAKTAAGYGWFKEIKEVNS